MTHYSPMPGSYDPRADALRLELHEAYTKRARAAAMLVEDADYQLGVLAQWDAWIAVLEGRLAALLAQEGR